MGNHAPPYLVLIADHDRDVRQALRLVCEESLGLTVIAEAADSDELLSLLETTPAHLLLVEWDLPGLSLSGSLKAVSGASRLVVISSHQEIRAEALAAGAHGFIYKGDPPDVLIALLRDLSEKR